MILYKHFLLIIVILTNQITWEKLKNQSVILILIKMLNWQKKIRLSNLQENIFEEFKEKKLF